MDGARGSAIKSMQSVSRLMYVLAVQAQRLWWMVSIDISFKQPPVG